MSEPPFNFRLRFVRSLRATVNADEHEIFLPVFEPSHQVILKARGENTTLQNAQFVVLSGSGWESAEAALSTGQMYKDILARTYARLRLGADFGDRAAKGCFTKDGLEHLENGAGHPVLNDVHGLMAYDRSACPAVVFASIQAEGIRGIQKSKFLQVYEAALNRTRDIDQRERIALELFNLSFFQKSVDGRFLLLMCGLEAMIDQQPRSQRIWDAIGHLAAQLSNEQDLENDERDLLRQSLGQLKRESIRQAGQRLIRDSVGYKDYNGEPGDILFGRSYGIRSRLVHGELPFPSREEVSGVVGQLEVLVSDLLSTDLADVG